MLLVRDLGLQPYKPVWQAMLAFTATREDTTPDEAWLVEHLPIFTQGKAGKEEHLINPGEIPVIYSDRGGQVTYHAPGQQILYVLLDLKRRKIGVRQLVELLERSAIETLAQFSIQAYARRDAPGIYIAEKKVGSLGLRICRGFSFHGLALNVAMDLKPFERIDPCGHRKLRMTQLADWVTPISTGEVAPLLVSRFAAQIGESASPFLKWDPDEYR